MRVLRSVSLFLSLSFACKTPRETRVERAAAALNRRLSRCQVATASFRSVTLRSARSTLARRPRRPVEKPDPRELRRPRDPREYRASPLLRHDERKIGDDSGHGYGSLSQRTRRHVNALDSPVCAFRSGNKCDEPELSYSDGRRFRLRIE